MTHHSPLRPDSRPAVKGMSLADLTAGTLYTRPARSGGSDGEPGIPSDDAEGAKMESGSSRNPGRASEDDLHFLQSSQAVSLSHSVLPNSSQDGTDRALPVSSTGAPAYSDLRRDLPDAVTSASSGFAAPPPSIDPAFFEGMAGDAIRANRERCGAARMTTPDENGWMPIETAPKDRVILLTNGEWVDQGWWSTSIWLGRDYPDGTWAVMDSRDFGWARLTGDYHPTHWQDRPAPPKPLVGA